MIREPRGNEASKRLPDRLSSKLIEATFKGSPMLFVNRCSCPKRQEAPFNKGIHSLSQSPFFTQRLECGNRGEKSRSVASLER